ncbi:MAG: RluA family pseudouridine synthase [Eubacteriales bacterium]|nr:RluA family pseudouridine synthase [Eubacteriales bacterium]MDY3333085.1 RluA family pseudouridine synthase [Gallibacter sp.]
MYKNFNYTITSEDVKNNIQVKDVLRKNLNFSSRLITKIKKNNGIRLNGELIPAWINPKEGDIVTVVLPEEKSDFQPSDIPINVVFEDEHLLIINKQPGHVVHPTASHQENTIANGITKYMQDTDQIFKLRFINRLDRDTSGLLILGKNSHSQNVLSKQMRDGRIKKEYIAIVCGTLDKKNGTIDFPIGRPDSENIKRAVMINGSECKTHYKTRAIYKDTNGNKYSELQIHLETGRTHQIRVHMSHIGHPILADSLYGTNSTLIDRQALHAFSLEFFHPITNDKLSLKADVPHDMQRVKSQLQEIIG